MRTFFATLCVAALVVPHFAFAFPFGGSIGVVRPCYNNAIFAAVGPPRGGAFIWTPASKTYQFGPPRRPGQWLLGLASAPYYCVVSILPVDVWPGTHIDMMGSSGAAAPTYKPPTYSPLEPVVPKGPTGKPMTPAEYCAFLKQNPTAPQPTVDPCTQ